MSDFNFDLSDEKLSAIEEAISQLEGDISETQQSVKRLEAIEFFDRGEACAADCSPLARRGGSRNYSFNRRG